jgi:primosomal protein N'
VVAAVTLDSLFSIPDFGMSERVFYLITRLREAASEALILQTRNAGESILLHAAGGNVLDFYREEIAEREETAYPPFSLFVKVTTSGTPEQIERKAAHLQSLFGEHHPHFTLGRELAMILRVPRSSWPSKAILSNLLLLTPDFLIKVDPESII